MTDEMRINETELESVSGGGMPYANGPYVVCGSYIVYTVVSGDVLSGIAVRFGVTVKEIAQWNQIKDGDSIYPGQKFTIYARTIR